jgi:hypothetical protein
MPLRFRLLHVLLLTLWGGAHFTPCAAGSKTNSTESELSSRHQLASHAIWRDGRAEWLTYAVKAPFRGHTLEGEAVVMVQPLRKGGKGGKLEGFQLHWSRALVGEQGRQFHQAELQWSVVTDQITSGRFIRGQMPGSVSARSLQKDAQGYQLNEKLGEGKSTLKSPLLLEESLFLELRNWPLQPGFVREIWWYPVMSSERQPKESVYARVEVVGGMQVLRDTQVWQVKVKPAQGRGAEVFVQCGGTHAVVQATLSDGSTFSLEKVERR